VVLLSLGRIEISLQSPLHQEKSNFTFEDRRRG
jgi:hypothetical protein